MILTKPEPILKGLAQEFTLNKTELAALIPDAYYSNTDHWKKIAINYVSTTGNQSKTVIFNPQVDPCVGNFFASEYSLNDFTVRNIVVYDFDNGKYEIPASELTLSEFDIDFDAPVVPSAIWTRDFSVASGSDQFTNCSRDAGTGQLVMGTHPFSPCVYKHSFAGLTDGTLYQIRITVDSNTLATTGFDGGGQLSLVNALSVPLNYLMIPTPVNIVTGVTKFNNIQYSTGFADILRMSMANTSAAYSGEMRISKIEIYPNNA